MKTQTEKAEEHSIDAWLDPEIKPEDPIGLPTFRIVYEAGFITGHTEGRREALEMAQGLVDRLRAIIELGKRDMSNPKYDSCFDGASEDLAKFEAWRDGK